MANLNLSQFGENTSVSDADYTFVWDSANSISKKVSRNSWLNSGTLTSDAPVTISQTWATTGTYTAAKINVTETAAANSASRFLDLQVGGVSKFYITKLGEIWTTSGNFNTTIARSAFLNTVHLGSSSFLGFGPTFNPDNGAPDTILLRDGAANTLALRNGAAAQTFRVYRSYLNAGVDYERLSFSHDGVQFGIGTERGGSGVAQPLRIFGGSSAALDFANGVSFRNASGGTTFMTVASSGNVGIGTTAPSEKLHVLGGKVLFGDATDATGTAGNGDLTLQAWRAPQLNIVCNQSSSNFIGLSIKVATTTLAGLLVNSASGEVKIGGLSSGGYYSTFYSNNVERMRIDTTGNVGIGTTSPSEKLHVAGNSNPSVLIENTLATGYSQFLFKNTVTTGASFFLNGSTQTGYGGPSSFNIIASTGPIGFHTASVTNALSIAQSGAATFANNVFLGGFIQLSNADGRISFDGGNKVFSTAANTYIQDLYRRAGSGDPNGTVTAPVGATYNRTDGGAGTSFYVKESGTGNTGWVGK